MEAGQVDFINKYVQVQQGKLNAALADVINLETQLQVAKEVIDNLQKQIGQLTQQQTATEEKVEEKEEKIDG